MTPTDLEAALTLAREARARADAATPGPWRSNWPDGPKGDAWPDEDGNQLIVERVGVPEGEETRWMKRHAARRTPPLSLPLAPTFPPSLLRPLVSPHHRPSTCPI